jgi:DNA-binding NtrC family response regulator
MNEKKKRVLIVDDEEALLFGLKMLLQNDMLLVEVARTLQEATELLHKKFIKP